MSDAPVRLGVLLSGTGRTLQNLIDRIADGRLDAAVQVVIADRAATVGIERARRAGLPHHVTADPHRTFELLREHHVELVCLAGYLRLLPIPADFEHRVLNIHPALLPRHGGPGHYGHRVHRAVLDAGELVSGCTVHFCDDRYDSGPILLQREVPVLPDDTVDSLAARVFEAECEAYPAAIELWRAREPGGLEDEFAESEVVLGLRDRTLKTRAQSTNRNRRSEPSWRTQRMGRTGLVTFDPGHHRAIGAMS